MKQKISDSEWIIMHALWKKPYQPLAEVVRNVGHPNWSYKSYYSFLKRMCDKGLVGFKTERGDKFYYALVDYQTSLDQEADNLLERITPYAAKDLVLNLIKSQSLSKEDTQEILSYLNQKETEAGE